MTLIWILLIIAAAIFTYVVTTIRNNRKTKKLVAAHEVEIQKNEASWFKAGWDDGREYEQREMERKKLIGRLI